MSTIKFNRLLFSRDRLHYLHDCEGCGDLIKVTEEHYAVALNVGEGELAPAGTFTFYHLNCLDPYVVALWLDASQSVWIGRHTD